MVDDGDRQCFRFRPSRAFAHQQTPTACDIDGQKIKDTTFQVLQKCARQVAYSNPVTGPQGLPRILRHRGKRPGSCHLRSNTIKAGSSHACPREEIRRFSCSNASNKTLSFQTSPQGISITQIRPCHPLQHGSGRRWTARLGSNAASESRPRNGSIFPNNPRLRRTPLTPAAALPRLYCTRQVGVTFPPAYQSALEHHILEIRNPGRWISRRSRRCHIPPGSVLSIDWPAHSQRPRRLSNVCSAISSPDGGWHLKPL